MLIDWLGKDATKIFRDPASHSHSAAASDLISMVCLLSTRTSISPVFTLSFVLGTLKERKPLSKCKVLLLGPPPFFFPPFVSFSVGKRQMTLVLISQRDFSPRLPRLVKIMYLPRLASLLSVHFASSQQSFITSVLILHSESLRYFDNDFLEYFSRSSWTMVRSRGSPRCPDRIPRYRSCGCQCSLL